MTSIGGLRGRRPVVAIGVVLMLGAALLVGGIGPGGIPSAGADPTLEERRQEREEAERRETEAREQREEAERREAEFREEVEQAAARKAELEAERDEAVARRDELEQEYMAAVAAFNEGEAELAATIAEIAELEESVQQLQAAVDERQDRVGELVRGMYMSGGAIATYEAVLRAEVIGETTRRLGYAQSAQRHQLDIIRGYVAEQRALEREQEALDDVRARQEVVAAELEERREVVHQRFVEQQEELEALRAVITAAEEELAELETVLATASEEVVAARQEEEAAEHRVVEAREAEQAEQQRLEQQRREEARRAAAAEASRASRSSGSSNTGSGIACPIGNPHHFTDTWGAPRSGGRSHQGTDIFAPMDTPIYAYESGTVSLSSNSLGGIVLYLRGDSGHRYYYAHLNGYVNGLSSGQRVQTGEQIGYNGNTGNARTTPPHLHIEVMTPGGGKTNPYPYMRNACG